MYSFLEAQFSRFLGVGLALARDEVVVAITSAG